MNKEIKPIDRKEYVWVKYDDQVKADELAKTYGWESDNWGRETSEISAEETANKADALERSLDDISSTPVRAPDKKDIITSIRNHIHHEHLPVGYYDDWDAVSYWGGQEARIKEYIEYLRLGPISGL